MRTAIGIDIGGGSTKIGLVREDGTVMARDRVVVGAGAPAEAILTQYTTAVDALVSGHIGQGPIGIGVGFPGPIYPGNRLGTLGNIPSLDDFAMADWLEARFGIPARMENDATAAGLGEAMFGGHPQIGRQLLVTAGTGVGVAFTVDGRPQTTSGSCLGDIGHTLLVFENPQRCRQGCNGCLESVASGDALERQLSIMIAEKPDGAIAVHARKQGRRMTVADAIQFAEQGDADAIQLLEGAGRWIGRAVATWAHIFSPDLILVGGGLSAAGARLLGPLESEARRLGLPFYLKDAKFEIATLGNDAGMVGAAAQIFLNTKSALE